ncbi:Tetratricopeptide repeat domain protein [uncultured Desulfatiglans sp.]|nr:Tetratricopeptide repeat domain protein [uncultured Desulfatiglans sp.]
MRFLKCLAMMTSVWWFFPIPGAVCGAAGEAQERCEGVSARVVSVQGRVEIRREGESIWSPVVMNDLCCSGDMIRVDRHSRAALLLTNETFLRLDQNTTITLMSLEDEEPSIIDLISGVVYFFSRIPRSLTFLTPFVNGGVEGTEFLVQVRDQETVVTVFAGRVRLTNQAGGLDLADGQSAAAPDGAAPVRRLVVRPRDAVHWSLYYPPILEASEPDAKESRPEGPSGEELPVREGRCSAESTEGDSWVDKASLKTPTLGCLTRRASLALEVGRSDEALRDLAEVLRRDPSFAPALALRALIALVQNDRDAAVRWVERALDADPRSPVVLMAKSYVQQAGFEIEDALKSAENAAAAAPSSGLMWSRVAELRLMTGDHGGALDAAQRSVALHPDTARHQTVLGFAFLNETALEKAVDAFERAISLDPSDPLPRLGLGLGKIRGGNLEGGRAELEIAVGLDPGNALYRSCLAKAYYDEKRDGPAAGQLQAAKTLDPFDPTPWFYDAIRKQSLNRPVEAMDDLQRSIDLNDHRAVYRSRLLLDQDLAARSAGLARIYSDLGFEQLGLVEGWRSVDADPADYSAHRFLAGSYAALSNHEIARVSEWLQSQLLQPLNVTPVSPRLAESDLYGLEGAGPADVGYNEFNPLFARNRLALQASGIAAGNRTWGSEVIQSGISDGFSYSVGQYHYQTSGYRPNNDFMENVTNVFLQTSLSPDTGVQMEWRIRNTDSGDLALRFEPDAYLGSLRQDEDALFVRFGLRHTLKPGSDLIASLIFQHLDWDLSLREPVMPGVDFFDQSSGDSRGAIGEVQHLYRRSAFNLVSGLGHFSGSSRLAVNTGFECPPFPPWDCTNFEKADLRHSNAYSYATLRYPRDVAWTLGASIDRYEGDLDDKTRLNPKLGVTYRPFADTILRGAVFRTLKRTLIANQTVEPTQIAGFNQFFDDANGADSWRFGLAMDQRLAKRLFAGIEASKRKIDFAYQHFQEFCQPPTIEETDWEEDLLRGYLYWAPHKRMSATVEFRQEKLTADPEYLGGGSFTSLETLRVPLGIRFFHPWGFGADLTVTYVDQSGSFDDPELGATRDERDTFWVTDVALHYRLPKRRGIVSMGVKNCFDESFRYYEPDAVNPEIYPERLWFVRMTLAF